MNRDASPRTQPQAHAAHHDAAESSETIEESNKNKLHSAARLHELLAFAMDDVDGQPRPRVIPADLPTSLDDRRHAPSEALVTETEMYDGWQGKRKKESNDHPEKCAGH